MKDRMLSNLNKRIDELEEVLRAKQSDILITRIILTDGGEEEYILYERKASDKDFRCSSDAIKKLSC